MSRRFFRAFAVVSCLLLLFAAFGCSDDNGYDTTGGGGGPGGSTGGNGDDAGDVADDTEDDIEDDVYQLCEYEPSATPTDPTKPCCFDDEDCWDSNVANAGDMYCYYAECTEGGEGTCRVPPSTEQHCWDDYDCPEGYECPYEDNPDAFQCDQPQMHETPATCVEIED